MGAHEIQRDQGKSKIEKNEKNTEKEKQKNENNQQNRPPSCLLYTSDAADD